MAVERLQKILARGGLASRRAAETLITEGRVRVNGKIVTELGSKADPRKDRIEVDGKRVVAEHPVYYALHKPRGYVTTLKDPEGRPTVANLLRPHGIEARVFPVGRLDFNTSGILLVTNDGEFSDGLLHPRKAVPKTYVVKVQGRMEPKDITRWRAGVELDDGRTLPCEAELLRYEGPESGEEKGTKTWFTITIHEGRNQQIRRMGDATGFRVMRLSRVAFAGITSEGLRPGDLRVLTFEELTTLKKEFGVPRSPSVAKGPPRAQPHNKLGPSPRRAGAPSPTGRNDRNEKPAPGKRTEIGPSQGGSWGRDPQGRDRPQSARGRHAYDRPPEEGPTARHGGWRGHGPDDQNPREVPRMPSGTRRAPRR